MKIKKTILLVLVMFFVSATFAADVRGEIGNVKWLLRNNEMSIAGPTVSKDEVISISVPETIEGIPVTKIMGNAFIGCKNLVEVNLPDTITTIYQQAFSGCRSLTEIELPKSLVTIGNEAFSGCSFSEIIIPTSVKTIGTKAFYCDTLVEIKILDAKVDIGKSAFRCSKVISLDLGQNVVSIGDSVFEYYPLESITIPNSVKSIGARIFYKAKKLKTINLSSNLESIGNSLTFNSLLVSSLPSLMFK